jgi:hypothetical protein
MVGEDDAPQERGTDRRDCAADQRDQAADLRDHAAELRDDDATRRDEVAKESGPRVGSVVSQAAIDRTAANRHDSAADRGRARGDRSAGLYERFDAERDRNTARIDREAAALERDDDPPLT